VPSRVPAAFDRYAPSVAADAFLEDWLDTYWRRSASPKAAADLARMNSDTDIRDVLRERTRPDSRAPGISDRNVNVAEGRYIASRIAGARYVELPSGDHVF